MPYAENRARYEPLVRQKARKYGLPEELFVAQIKQESHFNPNAGSYAGALGIAQIVPRYHPNVNPNDPEAALDYAAKWMAELVRKHGSYERALSVYNSGKPNAYLDPNFSDGQTYNYIRIIMGDFRKARGETSPYSNAVYDPDNILATVNVTYEEVQQLKDDGHDLAFKDGIPKYGLESTGNRVKDMQAQLKAVGFQCGNWGPDKDGVDGKFGNDTKKALIAFQKQQIEEGKLPKDTKLGVFDKNTEALLDASAPLEAKNQRPALKKGESIYVDESTTQYSKTNLGRTDPSGSWQTLDFSNEGKIEGVAERMVKSIKRGDLAEFNKLLSELPETKNGTVKVTYGSPLPGSTITSKFGQRDLDIAGSSKYHAALDLDVSYDANNIKVLSAAPGVIIFAGKKGGLGNTVEIRHADGMVTKYSHLDSINPEILAALKNGNSQVNGGVPIGIMGNTGLKGMSDHLHFAMEDINGRVINPETIVNTKGGAYKGVQYSEAQIEASVILAAIMDDAKKNKTFANYIASMIEKSPEERNRETRYAVQQEGDVVSPGNIPNAAKNSRGKTANATV